MNQIILRLLLSVSLILLGVSSPVGAAVAPETPAVNLTPQQWVGQNFVFLPLPLAKQMDGYGIFTAEQAAQGFDEDRSVRLAYGENVGKLLTVTTVSPYTAGDQKYDYVVAMTQMDTGNKFVGRTIRGSLEGITLADDIEKAKQQFIGKTIYPKRRSLELISDQPNMQSPASITIPIGSAVTVTDVYAGIQSREPISLIVSVNGHRAILPIAYSWTNQTVNTWTKNPPWQAALFMDDPHKTLGWSPDLWNKIESGTVTEGMTQEQILLTWGPPNRADKSDAGVVWFYGNKILKFNDDMLRQMENKPF